MFINGNWISRRNDRANGFFYENKHQYEGGTPAGKSFYELPQHNSQNEFCRICIHENYIYQEEQKLKESTESFNTNCNRNREKGKKRISTEDLDIDILHVLSVDSSDSLVEVNSSVSSNCSSKSSKKEFDDIQKFDSSLFAH
eukprot:Awhi_evm1s3752